MSISANPNGGIGDLRRSAGLSQQELASRAACSIGMVRMLEAGAVPRRSSVLPRVVAVLTKVEPAGNGLEVSRP